MSYQDYAVPDTQGQIKWFPYFPGTVFTFVWDVRKKKKLVTQKSPKPLFTLPIVKANGKKQQQNENQTKNKNPLGSSYKHMWRDR